ELRGIDGRVLATDQDFVDYIGSHAGVPVVVKVRRGDALVDLTVTPRDVGGGVGRIGIGLTTALPVPPLRALVVRPRDSRDITHQTVGLVGKLLRREMKPQAALHGPLEIGKLAGEA